MSVAAFGSVLDLLLANSGAGKLWVEIPSEPNSLLILVVSNLVGAALVAAMSPIAEKLD